MKLMYLANLRLPTEKAHGLQVMKMAEAFSRLGLEVELAVPWRFNKIKENPFDYYGVEKIFKIKKIPSLDLVKFGKIGFLIQSATFSRCAFFYAIFKKAEIIYSRDELPLFFLSFFKKNLFWETHTAKSNFAARRVLKKCSKIISVSGGLKDFYVKRGAAPEKILVAPDGVEIKNFQSASWRTKFQIREKLNLPGDKNLIGYAGMLKTMGMEKGIETALKSLEFLGEENVLVFVGGREKDIEGYKKMAKDLNLEKKVIFAGQVRHRLVSLYLKAFDVLIAPFPSSEHYKFYMSPLKIFEYMAAGVPIVASDLPAIREILNERSAVLVSPDSAKSLAAGIKSVLENKNFAENISRQAYSDVQNYTWEKRAKNIYESIVNSQKS